MSDYTLGASQAEIKAIDLIIGALRDYEDERSEDDPLAPKEVLMAAYERWEAEWSPNRPEPCIHRVFFGGAEDVTLEEFLHQVIQDEETGLGIALALLKRPGDTYLYNDEAPEDHEAFSVTCVTALAQQINDYERDNEEA